MKVLDQTLKQNLVRIALKQITAGVDFKKPRIKQIQKFEDMYANKVGKSLKNRFNLPLPILSGYVDTLKSKIDDAPLVQFERMEEADTKVAKKVNAAWELDSGEARGQWPFIDRLVKNIAIFSGRGIYKIFSESEPTYCNHLEARDYYDFYCEPQGGPDLEKHLFCGEQNIFRSKKQLIEGANAGNYEKVSVALLISNADKTEGNKVQKDLENKLNRSRALNLNPNNFNYVGETIYNLTEHYMVYENTRYYLLLDEASEICVKACELKDLFSKDEQTGDALYPYVSFATHEDNYNFWSKGPCDDVYPIAEAMRVIFNETLNNLYKRTWGQRAYDPRVFTDPSKLDWKPEGLVEADSTKGPIKDGIYTFDTPDNTTITMNLMGFVDNYMGQKTGLPPNAQGAGDKNQKVGVFFGQMEQVSDRLGLTNKIYKGAWTQLGKRYLYGLKDHLNEKMAVKILGANGVEWEKLDKNEITDLNIKVTGGNDEAKFNEMKSQRKMAALSDIASNQTIAGKINPNWLIEEKLKSAGYDAEEIKRALDVNNFGDDDLMTEAAQSIQAIINGKTPEINRGATSGFMQKIIDFAYDTSLKMEIFDRLVDYAKKHTEIAAENMARKAQGILRDRAIAAASAPSPDSILPGRGPAPEPTPKNPLEIAMADATKARAASQGATI